MDRTEKQMAHLPAARVGSLRRWLAPEALARRDVVRIASITLLFMAAFSGRFSFDRFMDEASRVPWLELRLWFTLLAFVGWLMLRADTVPGVRYAKPLAGWLLGLGVFYAYLLGNDAVLGRNGIELMFWIDTFLLFLQVFLAFQLVSLADGIQWLARVAMGIGVALVAFCLAGFGNPELNGGAWAPFGGPITFYRLEFLAFCAALYLYAVSRSARRPAYLLWASICLFASLASLSKAAFLASTMVIAGLLGWLLIIRQWNWAIGLFASAVVSYLCFFLLPGLPGQNFRARVTEAGYLGGLSLDVRPCSDGPQQRAREPYCLKDFVSGAVITPEELSAKQQQQLLALPRAAGYSGNIASLSEALRVASSVLVIGDASGRLSMAIRAWRMFKSHPWFGSGIGSFELGSIDPYTKRIVISRYPHNIVLETAATAGVVGLSLLVVLIFLSFVLLARAASAAPALVYFLAYAVFVFVTALFSGDYFDFRLFWLIGAFVFASSCRSSPTPSRP